MDPFVIVGAGQAGGWAAKTLRSEGYAGRIVLVGDEPHPPHERPPLSKAVLAGEAAPESTHLARPEDFARLELDWWAGTRVVSIDRATKHVAVDLGEMIAYEKLILCTGSRVRRLQTSSNVFYLRSIEDSVGLRRRLGDCKHLIVIGAGWIGLEVAAAARKAGVAVTVVEGLDRVCARAVPPEVSRYLLYLHERNGVVMRLGQGVKAIDQAAVELSDGSSVAGDLIVAGIGIVPNVELAQAAGLAVDNGIVVDECGRTSDPDVLAAGDCANTPLACLGRRVRLECWANAQNQAIVAAKAALGREALYDDLPWFWSDQYDLNLQMLGMPLRWPEPVVRGDPGRGGVSHFYLEDDRIVGIVSLNASRDLRAARKLMQTRKPVRAADLANTAVQLQRL